MAREEFPARLSATSRRRRCRTRHCGRSGALKLRGYARIDFRLDCRRHAVLSGGEHSARADRDEPHPTGGCSARDVFAQLCERIVNLAVARPLRGREIERTESRKSDGAADPARDVPVSKCLLAVPATCAGRRSSARGLRRCRQVAARAHGNRITLRSGVARFAASPRPRSPDAPDQPPCPSPPLRRTTTDPGPTPAVQWLIGLNVLIYFLQVTARRADGHAAVAWVQVHDLAMCMPWTVLTYMFVHASFWHIARNMLLLWVFGPRVERAWGSGAFVRYYLLCGLGGMLAQSPRFARLHARSAHRPRSTASCSRTRCGGRTTSSCSGSWCRSGQMAGGRLRRCSTWCWALVTRWSRARAALRTSRIWAVSWPGGSTCTRRRRAPWTCSGLSECRQRPTCRTSRRARCRAGCRGSRGIARPSRDRRNRGQEQSGGREAASARARATDHGAAARRGEDINALLDKISQFMASIA